MKNQSSDPVRALADEDESPSAGYASIDTGVEVPPAKSKFEMPLSTTLSSQRTPELPLPGMRFGQASLPKANLIFGNGSKDSNTASFAQGWLRFNAINAFSTAKSMQPSHRATFGLVANKQFADTNSVLQPSNQPSFAVSAGPGKSVTEKPVNDNTKAQSSTRRSIFDASKSIQNPSLVKNFAQTAAILEPVSKNASDIGCIRVTFPHERNVNNPNVVGIRAPELPTASENVSNGNFAKTTSLREQVTRNRGALNTKPGNSQGPIESPTTSKSVNDKRTVISTSSQKPANNNEASRITWPAIFKRPPQLAPVLGDVFDENSTKFISGQKPSPSLKIVNGKDPIMTPGLQKQVETRTVAGDVHSKLLGNDMFTDTSADKITHETRGLINRSHTSFQEHISGAATYLNCLCISNGLPMPLVESKSIIDTRGSKEYQVTIKIGYRRKNVYNSSTCKSLGDAMFQAHDQAFQSLADLGMVIMMPRINQSGNDSTDCAGKHTTPEPRKSQRHPNLRHAHTPRQDTSPDFQNCDEDHSESQSSDYNYSSLDDVDPKERGQGPIFETLSRKRKRSPAATPPKHSMPVLLSILTEIPDYAGEERISAICEYLEMDKPKVEELYRDSQSALYRASFASPLLKGVLAEGSSRTMACLRLEGSIMSYLKVVGVGNFMEKVKAKSTKRIKRNHNVAVEQSVDNSDQEAEHNPRLFVVDPRGDDELRV